MKCILQFPVYKICLLVKVNIKLVRNSQSSCHLAGRSFCRVYWRPAAIQSIFPWITRWWQYGKYPNLNKNRIHWQDSGSEAVRVCVCEMSFQKWDKWHLYYFLENHFSLPHHRKRSHQEYSTLCPYVSLGYVLRCDIKLNLESVELWKTNMHLFHLR